eukprot:GILK01002180.1.p1 GENE.GILK01002180.1~~GILK01002180.1.p1  ORF type:complete len:385 (-),score=49.42 GILK01002180.1:290-1342(-)
MAAANSHGDFMPKDSVSLDLRAQVSRLQQQVKDIQQVVKMQATERRTRRPRIDRPSVEITPHNPYSRLMALHRFGAVRGYERVRVQTVIIIGVGGLGAGVAEILTRAGVGKLILVDRDVVDLANLTSLFFRPEMVGWNKVQAVKHSLAEINPDVAIEVIHGDITTDETMQRLREKIETGAMDGGSRVDNVLCCVDNFAARKNVNDLCLALNQRWMDARLSTDAMSGHIQFVVPGQSQCIDCAPLSGVDARHEEMILNEPGFCVATLPTCEAVVSGLLGQMALKCMVQFGEVPHYMGFNARTNHFPKTVLSPPNPHCPNMNCSTRQSEDLGGSFRNSPTRASSSSYRKGTR